MQWIHRAPDVRELADASLASIASRMPWSAPAAPDMFRGLLLETAFAVARARRFDDGAGDTLAIRGEGTELLILPDRNANLPLARALFRTPKILAEGLEWPNASKPTIGTQSSEVAGWPVAIGVALVVTAGAAVAVILCADEAAQVIDRKLARDADYALMVEQHAQALRLVRAHQDREDAARARGDIATDETLPLDEASKSALGALEERQAAIVARGGAPGSIGAGGPSWWWLLLAALAGGAAYAATEKKVRAWLV